jgi:hypothetical protein
LVISYVSGRSRVPSPAAKTIAFISGRPLTGARRRPRSLAYGARHAPCVLASLGQAAPRQGFSVFSSYISLNHYFEEKGMEMDRLSTGEKIAGGSAVLLFIFMFFDWFTVSISGGEGFFTVSAGGNAWEVFSWIDLFMMLTIIVALAVAVIRLSDAIVEPPFSINAAVAILGGLSVLFILYRIIDPPLDTGDFSGVDVSRAIGVYLGLLAAAGITYGGYRAMQEEGTSFGDLGDQLSAGRGPTAGSPTQPPSSTATPPPPPPPPSSGQGGPRPQ